MGEEFFGRGAGEALKTLGLMADDVALAWGRHQARKQGQMTPAAPPMPTDELSGRVPYPEKNPAIGAERFTRMLREMDEEDANKVNPDNANYAYSNNLDRLTSWGSSTNIDEGRSSGGLMVPANPRG
jgi:hypothetical protein